jgi:hypothetical protein
MAPPSRVANQHQASDHAANGSNHGPFRIESLNEFYLGPREGLRVTITKPGDHARGILDYGTVTGPYCITFIGFIAAVRHQYQTIPELALDSGELTQPNGRVLTGDFSIIYPEGSVLSFFQIPVGAQFSFSVSPHIFRGTISNGIMTDPSTNAQVWAVENSLKH